MQLLSQRMVAFAYFNGFLVENERVYFKYVQFFFIRLIMDCLKKVNENGHERFNHFSFLFKINNVLFTLNTINIKTNCLCSGFIDVDI